MASCKFCTAKQHAHAVQAGEQSKAKEQKNVCTHAKSMKASLACLLACKCWSAKQCTHAVHAVQAHGWHKRAWQQTIHIASAGRDARQLAAFLSCNPDILWHELWLEQGNSSCWHSVSKRTYRSAPRYVVSCCWEFLADCSEPALHLSFSEHMIEPRHTFILLSILSWDSSAALGELCLGRCDSRCWQILTNVMFCVLAIISKGQGVAVECLLPVWHTSESCKQELALPPSCV